MITTSDTIIVQEDSIEKYTAPAIVCLPTYNPDTEIATVELSVINVSVPGQTNHIRYFSVAFTKAELDAQTISASATTDKWMEAVEEKTKAYLEDLNPSATFTIV